jgi:hypothetical protein
MKRIILVLVFLTSGCATLRQGPAVLVHPQVYTDLGQITFNTITRGVSCLADEYKNLGQPTKSECSR